MIPASPIQTLRLQISTSEYAVSEHPSAFIKQMPLQCPALYFLIQTNGNTASEEREMPFQIQRAKELGLWTLFRGKFLIGKGLERLRSWTSAILESLIEKLNDLVNGCLPRIGEFLRGQESVSSVC